MVCSGSWRIKTHPILGSPPERPVVEIIVDGRAIRAFDGEPVAAALLANGMKVFRYTESRGEPRGLSCAIGQCTDCMMTVDGVPNVRTCVTPVRPGMRVQTQHGLGRWGEKDA